MHVIQQKCPFLLPNAHIARSNAPVNEVAVQILTEQTAQTHTHTHTHTHKKNEKVKKRTDRNVGRNAEVTHRIEATAGKFRYAIAVSTHTHTHTHTHTLNGIWTESSRRIHN